MISLIFLIFLVILITGIVIAAREDEKKKGICVVAEENSAQKEKNKKKILELLHRKGECSNHNLREALNVGHSSVARYLDELEREGSVIQVGNTGQSVTYRLKS